MIGIVWVLVVVLGLLPPLLREAHTDIAWPFYLVNQMLHGARQGRDFLEVNPPLFLWLAAPPVLIERLTGLDAWKANTVLVALLAAASLGCCVRLLSRLGVEDRPRRWLALAIGFAALVLPRGDFAQREHLSFLFALPYVLLAAARIQRVPASRGIAMAIGLLGAIGFSLKPWFLAAWLGIEALVATHLGRATLRRTELWCLVVAGALYLAAVLLLVPDYLPMAVRLAPWYGRYLDNGLAGALVMAGPLLLLTAVAALAMRLAAARDEALSAALAVAFLGYFLAAIAQRKGFGYHYLAATCFGVVLLARGWQTLAPLRRPPRPSALIARGGVPLLLVTAGRAALDAADELRHPAAARYRTDPTYPLLLPAVRELAAGQAIVVLSSNPAVAWPLTLDAGTTWASRYMSLWPMPALYHSELWSLPPRVVTPNPPESRPPFERQFLDDVVADLERWPPRLIIVLEPDPTVPGWGGARRFDYLAYFGADPRFERIMAGYRKDRQVGAYTLWVRGP